MPFHAQRLSARSRRLVVPLLLSLALLGCAAGPRYEPPSSTAPQRWHAPLPHGGRVTNLSAWWRQFDDPSLDQLITAAESNSPSLTRAWASIERARATLTSAESRFLPELGARAAATRSRQQQTPDTAAVGTTRSAGADASWEIDLFGKARRQAEAARARVDARVGEWHEARVSLAAAVGDAYVQYRACTLLTDAYARELRSLAATGKATVAAVRAGFSPSSDVALAAANFASARATLIQQRAQCELLVKSLVALTGQEEASVRQQLAARAGKLPQPRAIRVHQVPTQVLRQRPDLAVRERELAAAAAEIGVAYADLYPSLALSGAITVSAGSFAPSFTSWSFGPSVSIPVFDGGRRRAALAMAKADFTAALASYQQTVRDAVREVEHALVNLNSIHARAEEAMRAHREYRRYFGASERHWRAGGESLLDLEQARRLALNAEIQDILLRRDRVLSWIALYKALGGGWQPGRPAIAPAAASPTQPKRKPS